MASLLTETEISESRAILSDHFDTFARDIVVFKAPKIIVADDVNINPLAGYSQPEQYTSVSTEIESGVFPAIRVYKNNQPVQNVNEFKALFVGDGEVRIKVREEAMNFIENGITERILVDGINFELNGEVFTQNYIGEIFYYYQLKATK